MKTIFVDIDGTIAKTVGTDYAGAQPSEDDIRFVNQLYDQGHRIVYWTARGTMSGETYFGLTQSQLDRWGCKYHELRMGKPAYDLFIEDRSADSVRRAKEILGHVGDNTGEEEL